MGVRWTVVWAVVLAASLAACKGNSTSEPISRQGPVTSLLPQTGQTACYDESGSAIACAGSGQDGELLVGVAWPAPRFTDNGDGTLTDGLTDLVWLQDVNCIATSYSGFDTDGTAGDGAVTWANALAFVAGMNAGAYPLCAAGHADWRLPNLLEIRSLLNFNVASQTTWLAGQGFGTLQSTGYWTSTTLPSAAGSAYVEVNGAANNLTHLGVAKTDVYFVMPVRGDSAGALYGIPRTGQMTSYAAGDDGDLQAGRAWPVPRFTDNGDGTVSDRLTRLTWVADPTTSDVPGSAYPGTLQKWDFALLKIAELNSVAFLGHSDWRMPNRLEMLSLKSLAEADDGTWLNSQGFANVSATDFMWASTTVAHTTTAAFSTQGTDINQAWYPKSNTASSRYWPVRGGR